MIVTLKDYEPLGSQIIVELVTKSTSEGGIILGKGKIDRWMECVKKGTVVPEIEVGDYVLLGDPTNGVRLTFGDVEHLQTTVHNVIGRIPKKNVKKVDLSLN